ncbi:hypothetical protein BGX26_008227 [Mortierella sp. AD094]|nr:hypothetical protein BGX26_008227 [Mortierella sp. AD094]
MEKAEFMAEECHFSPIGQHHTQQVYSQLHQQQPQQYQVLLSGRSRRRSIREVIPTQRCPSMRSSPSVSLLRRDAGQRTSSLLRQRKQTLRYPRYQATKPSPLAYSTSKSQVCLEWTDKPLPPIPVENNIPGKQYIGEEFAGSDKYHDAESSRAFTIDGKEEILSVVANQDIRSDHHCPLTDDSKIQLMEPQRDMSYLVSTLPAKPELEQEDTLTSPHPIPPSPARASPISRLENFRLESSNPKETDQGTHVGVITAHNTSPENIITGKQMSEPKRPRRHGSQRLKRSESNSAYCHRPSLSLNSSKKALLSLQDRRVCKPHAKVHRLPDIKTTATSTPTPTTAATFENDIEPSNVQCTSEAMSDDLLILCSDTPNIATHLESQAAVTESVGEEGIVETTLNVHKNSKNTVNLAFAEVTEPNTYKVDAVQNREQCPGLDEVKDVDASNEPDTDICVLTTEPQEHAPTGPRQCITKSTFGSALSSALEALTIDPRPELDAKETKRFVKRSHALKELEATEGSYVNDLDILLHVYLRVLETKSWFPQIIQVKMCRCVNGLLAMHRNFHSRVEASASGNSDHERHSPLRVYRNLAESVKILSHDNYLYSTFCELRMRTVNEINKSAGQATMALLQRESKDLMLQQGRPSTRSDLKDFLIKPIQRVCRYPLLLKEILRLTSENDPEYQYIEQAYQLVKEKAREMDENQRIVERRLLTEQFLKKLPDTSFPRKMGLISNKEQSISSDMNLSNSTNASSSIHPHQTSTSSIIYHFGNSMGLTLNSGFASDNCFDFGPGLEGFNPAALTKAFAGTLGSIILAGALEYVVTPDMPVRLKYYGCFLFETMLIVVKAKKSSLYEPRQWLPLRFCELHETTRLDGYTQFGWRIMFDQFRIDFGADSAAEQQVWINTLQDRIRAAKEAYVRLPRDIATFETIASSLPWRANNSFAAGYMNACQQQTSHQSPLPSPSPWSSCSSAIPSPLMPPPPSASSSTMMMAMSSMVTIEPEKWSSRGYGQTLDNYAYRQDLCPPDHQLGLKFPEKARQSSVGNHESIRIGGMASNWNPDKEVSDQNQCLPPRNAHDYQTRPELQPLKPSTPMPWLLYEHRPRNNSFDVTRVFASSNSSIKPSQRVLVQSLFKDVSTEHIWTSSTVIQPSLQPASVLSRYSSSNPLNGSQPIAMPSSPQMNASGVFNVPSAWDSTGSATLLGEDNYASIHAAGSPSSSLTSRLLRRRGSGMGAQPSPSGAAGNLDKNDWDRRRNSATSAIAGTLSLNFRKNSDPQQHRHHRRSSSIVENGRYGSDSQEGVSSSGGGCETPVGSRVQVLGKPAVLTQESYSPLSNVGSTESRRDDHSEGPPLGTGKEVLDTLNSVGEAARSRRGNNDRVIAIDQLKCLISVGIAIN